jgi:ABC-2 type transport system permease protein
MKSPVVVFTALVAILLALIGLLTSLWAEKFDHNAAVTNFVITPLTMLSGTFYVIDNLSPTFQAISRANPFFYVISGFRFGFLGTSDVDVGTAFGIMAFCVAALFTWALTLMNRGTGIRD